MIDEANGVRRISHTGGIPGFNSILATLPDADVHLAVISNSSALSSGVVVGSIVRALRLSVP